MSRTVFRWKFAPLDDDSDTDGPNRIPRAAAMRNWMTSKAFWRSLSLFTFLLVVVQLVRTRTIYVVYDRWITNGSSTRTLPSKSPGTTDVDWTQYAYCQYATDEAYLCNSLMLFESLKRLQAKAEFVLMFPDTWTVDANASRKSSLLVQARDEYGVRLVPIKNLRFPDGDKTWAESFNKLLAFNQTSYRRVLSLDSDSIVLQNMDELFLMPESKVAMPRAYWLNDTLSSQLILLEPSTQEFRRIMQAFQSRATNEYDMEIMNRLYGTTSAILPHRQYDLITGEFREEEHRRYLGSQDEVWDPERAVAEAKFIHFSDYPIAKPWKTTPASVVKLNQPRCTASNVDGSSDCRNLEQWQRLYLDFEKRREAVCGREFAASNIMMRERRTGVFSSSTRRRTRRAEARTGLYHPL